MKKIILSALLIGAFSFTGVSQNNEDDLTCYQKYAKKFEERGAFPVEDGTYNDVIITFRKGSFAECYFGKVRVKDKAVVTHEMFLKFEDDTYEKIVRNFKYKDQAIDIIDGISRTMVTDDEELINVLFYKKIRPKKKSYKKAPDPNFDF